MVGATGCRRRRGIFAYGDALFHGSAGATHLNAPIVGMAATPDGGATGWSPPTGDLRLRRRSLPRVRRRQPAQQAHRRHGATPDGGGYWLVAADGGIFAYGDALFHGSAGASPLNKPIVGMAATPDGGGYWLVAADGGSSPTAPLSSTGPPRQPAQKAIVGMVAPATPTGSTTSWWVPALGNQPWQWEIDHPLDLSNATDMGTATRCPTAHPPRPGDL